MLPIEATRFTWCYQGQPTAALKDLSLAVSAGERVAMLGGTGAGKTTFCLCLAGLLPHLTPGVMAGVLRVFGDETRRAEVAQLGRSVGIVFQDPEAQFLSMNVRHEIAFGLENRRVPRSEMLRRINWISESLGMLDLLDRNPYELSGGQKQLVALASTLVLQPRLLVLDSALSDLDFDYRQRVQQVLGELRAERETTLLLSANRAEHFRERADRVILLHDGHLLVDETISSYALQASHLPDSQAIVPDVTRVFISLRRRGFPDVPLPLTNDEAVPVLLQLTHGKATAPPAELPSERVTGSGTPFISARGLSHVYPGGEEALRDISFDIFPGETIALIGPNGSGKTTLAKTLNGLLTPTTGILRIGQITVHSGARRRRLPGVGIVFQNPQHQLFCSTVTDEVLFAPRALGLDMAAATATGAALIERAGLEKVKQEEPWFLSRGEKHKLALVSVLMMDPRVLILDEPSTGIVQSELAGLLEHVMEQNRRKALTLVVITHNLSVVTRYCTRALVLNAGRLVFDGSVSSLLEDRRALVEASLELPELSQLARRVPALGLPTNVGSVEEFVESVCRLVTPHECAGRES